MRRLPLRSPPRMRGKAKNRCRSCPLTRITPACAGKSHKQRQAQRPRRDHPRVCGEKQVQAVARCRARGSSPRMRGKVKRTAHADIRVGITPAYAGKSPNDFDAADVRQDHPRVCGEKSGYSGLRAWVRGSPPRMRGKDYVAHACKGRVGITPAYAGKRPSARKLTSRV